MKFYQFASSVAIMVSLSNDGHTIGGGGANRTDETGNRPTGQPARMVQLMKLN